MRLVVIKVCLCIKSTEYIIKTVVAVLAISSRKLCSDDERIQFAGLLCQGEWLFVHLVAIVI